MAENAARPHRSFATTDPMNMSSTACWVEEEKADRRTLIQCNQKYMGPFIEKEYERAVKKCEAPKGVEGETRHRDSAWRRQEATKGAISIALNNWLNEQGVMGANGYGNPPPSNDREEEQLGNHKLQIHPYRSWIYIPGVSGDYIG